ncbi:MAG: hypothetical protein IIZ93_07410 [Acidaminococcaceae bacterium]|nr:hypothetical protein [Acidaminococcaceae bacterium]
MEKELKLVEREQYDNEGMETFLIFYIDGKKEGSAKLFSENKANLPEDKKAICKSFNPVDFAPIEKIVWSKEATKDEDDIADWLNSFGYDSSVIGKLY